MAKTFNVFSFHPSVTLHVKLLHMKLLPVKLLALLFTAALATGCISAKSKPVAEAAAATPPSLVEPVTPATPDADSSSDAASDSLTSWIVAKGEHLWGISAVEEVYNLPEQWPLLYKSNLDQIEDADLIYPGQVLQIPRDVSQSEIDAAVHHARNRGPWALGPVELTDKEYLRKAY